MLPVKWLVGVKCDFFSKIKIKTWCRKKLLNDLFCKDDDLNYLGTCEIRGCLAFCKQFTMQNCLS